MHDPISSTDPASLSESHRLDALAAILAIAVERLRELRHRCGDTRPVDSIEISQDDALNCRAVQPLIDGAVDAAENGGRQ